MDRKVRFVLLTFSIIVLLAACVPGGPLPSDIASALTATAYASTFSGITPTGEFGVSPDPVYYGSGCEPGQSTQLIAYLSSTGAWTKDAVVPAGATVVDTGIGLVYEFLDIPTTVGIPGKTIPTFTKEEKIPGYYITTADLSTETFNGKPGKLMIDYFVSAVLMYSTSPFTASMETKTVYTSGYISVPVLPCGKPTPTPVLVSYYAPITISPDTIYKGDCTGGEPQEFTVAFKPGAPVTDPAIEFWTVLRYYPLSTGTLFGDISYQLFKVGDTWQTTIKSSDWSAITEDGFIFVSIRAQTGDPTSPTILEEWNNAIAGITPVGVTLKMCKPSAPALILTCPPDTKYTTISASGFATTYGFPTTTGGCSGDWYFSCTPPSGSTFPVGTTAVTCTAIDSCGSTASCKFNVTINYFAPVSTDTPVAPTDIPAVSTNTPVFDCSQFNNNPGACSQYQNFCQWTQTDPQNPNTGVCTNKP